MSSRTSVKNRLCLEFAALKRTCPKGIYVAPAPDEPLLWTGVLFPRRGPFDNAVLRFEIVFSDSYPERPPVINFLSDVFHPLITPLTTYTHASRDANADTFSSASADRLPPGGFALRHGFPEWYDGAPVAMTDARGDGIHPTEGVADAALLPHIVEVLQYMRVAFDTEAVLDSIPLALAANSGAWHAWRSYRSKALKDRVSPRQSTEADVGRRSMSPRQQPGGARQPGEWNWQGVWEARVRNAVRASTSEAALYGSDGDGVITFQKLESSTPAPATT